MQDTHLSDLKFSALNLHPKLLEGIEDAGFEYCTPIQALALPLALEGKDVAGQAQTGTGKTAAFLLATMQRLILEDEKKAAELKAEAPAEQEETETAEAESDSEQSEDKSAISKKEKSAQKGAGAKDLKAIRSLILAPTRELAIQIHKDAVQLSKHTDLKLGLAYGGTGYESQRATIEAGVDILIGTPGRVIDYFKQGVFHLNNIQVAVMDEADRMFDLGFITDIRYLLRRMPEPKSRLNLLFSATLSFRVDELAYEHMNAPEPVKVESEMVVQRIEEVAYYPAQNEKISLLINLLKQGERDRALVFINTKHEAAKIFDWLEANDLKAAILSGDVPQDRREKLLKRFHDGIVDILVATDVAARGLHIPNVSHVYNYDLPQEAEDYVHRTGRTARAGASGHAVSFICEKYAYSMMDIEEFIGHALPVQPIDEALLVPPENKPAFRERKPRDTRGRQGGRSQPDDPSRSAGKPQRIEDSSPRKERSESPASPRRNYDDVDSQMDKPMVKPAVSPEDIEGSKFVAPPSKFSIRFGEIPAIG
jgi:ATP-dependent RNA helicase RhlB